MKREGKSMSENETEQIIKPEAQHAPEGQKAMGFGQFALRSLFVTACVIAVLFFIKIWIMDTLKDTFAVKPSYQQAPYQGSAQKKTTAQFKSKENIAIDWKNAADYIGAYVTVKGKIVSAYNNKKVCYLNFHEDYKNHLTLVIFASSFKKFPGYPEKYYLGKEIEVQGRVKDYNGRVEIIVDSPEQIKVKG
jgi:DNA/RNA endonuclease YhcR with UshA esterase domain